jgi:predicted DNA-binding transcriptional regulator AlpA
MANLIKAARVNEKAGGISDVTRWKWIRDGKLPAGIVVSPQLVLWDEAEVDAAIAKLLAELPRQKLQGMVPDGQTDANRGARQKRGGRPRKQIAA